MMADISPTVSLRNRAGAILVIVSLVAFGLIAGFGFSGSAEADVVPAPEIYTPTSITATVPETTTSTISLEIEPVEPADAQVSDQSWMKPVDGGPAVR